MKYLIIILFFISEVQAQPYFSTPPYPTEGSKVVPALSEPEQTEIEVAVPEEAPLKKHSKDHRAETFGTVMVGYQFITSWLPSKKTLSYTHNFNQKWSLEAEYSWASIGFPIVGIDLGSIKEKRFTLQARRFVGNSFNFTFGGAVNEFKARLGSDFIDNLGHEINSDFTVQNLGITLGLGNRWQLENGFTLGIDWLRLNIPVYETKLEDKVLESVGSEGDRDDIKKVIRAVNHIPTFVLLGVNLGYSF